MLQIQNCTASFQLFPNSNGHVFNDHEFHQLALFGWDSEYDPQRFHAIIMRIRHCEQPGGRRRTTAALVFQTGKVVLTGVPEPGQANRMAHRFTRRLQHSMNAAGNVGLLSECFASVKCGGLLLPFSSTGP
jgi:TATA-box binding protein (TBP) (component of TFIID and TFIIIB)